MDSSGFEPGTNNDALCNKPSGSIHGWELSDKLSEYQLLSTVIASYFNVHL
jgi:hypothetical protein